MGPQAPIVAATVHDPSDGILGLVGVAGMKP
jgi:hypothetical protein